MSGRRYVPNAEQLNIVGATDPVLVVLGGAGTGKTTTAAAAARAHLERVDLVASLGVPRGSRRQPRRPAPDRVLFLSFSRASVARITERSQHVLGPCRDRTDITTFHALAWHITKRFGSVIDLPRPYLLTRAQAMLFPGVEALQYKDLVPRALDILAVPAVGQHLKARWSLIICDEFQDTDDGQYALLDAIRGDARLLLLGDPNQCIYSNLPDAIGVSPERLDRALTLPGARRVELPEASFRDPSGVIPAVAAAIRRREFDSDAVGAALESGRLQIHWERNTAAEAETVAATVESLQAEGSVAVFSHHNDALAKLSDELIDHGVEHEIVGLSESLSSAIDAQLMMMARFATGLSEWRAVLAYLAIFVTSSVRGRQAPNLAYQILGQQAGAETLTRRLVELQERLRGVSLKEALTIAAGAHAQLGLPSKSSAWFRAAMILQTMAAAGDGGAQGSTLEADGRLSALEQRVDERRVAMLTDETTETEAPVQLMGLYQTKGREADATVIVLRASDFFGTEKTEPFEEGSRLLYVVFSRARQRVVVLIFGDDLQALVAPLATLARSA
jgi:DNA helicase II / ATP-dependent DNA helicase PcrA